MFQTKFYENPIKHTDAIKIPQVDGEMHTPYYKVITHYYKLRINLLHTRSYMVH